MPGILCDKFSLRAVLSGITKLVRTLNFPELSIACRKISGLTSKRFEKNKAKYVTFISKSVMVSNIYHFALHATEAYELLNTELME